MFFQLFCPKILPLGFYCFRKGYSICSGAFSGGAVRRSVTNCFCSLFCSQNREFEWSSRKTTLLCLDSIHRCAGFCVFTGKPDETLAYIDRAIIFFIKNRKIIETDTYTYRKKKSENTQNREQNGGACIERKKRLIFFQKNGHENPVI